jgi:1-deoxy-D-xylulose-5-phosphate synthase
MHTLRQTKGISGFAKMAESEYDCFGAGHSSTSISAALGMSVAKQLTGKRTNNCIAVIGDGAITGGMAFEAMNCAGYLKSRMMVILNDNGQVSLPTGTHSAGGVVPAGALSSYTSRLLSSKPFQDFRSFAKGLSRLMPSEIQDINAKIDEYARGLMTGGGTLFEELGFYYIGPVDGHDLDNLIPILENLRDSPSQKPVLLHVKTEKGYGYPPAEAASDKYHGVAKFDVSTGRQFKGVAKTPSLTTVFANALCEIAAEDRNVVGITAAMPGGTGMDIFGKRFPKRTFDVGIAEQHAVTFAAGMVVDGLKPFCCIYSTFMQRGYDQVVHDVVIQKLPVRMILDRAGLVGNDGPTHHGSFDLSYLGALPHIVIMAPSDEIELVNMLETAYETNDLPSVVRYPRGTGYGVEILNSLFGYNVEEVPKRGQAVPRGKGRIMPRPGAKPRGPVTAKVAILSVGTRLATTLEAANDIEQSMPGVAVTVADARFVKPLDADLIKRLARENDVLLTIEENSIGGFGSQVQQLLLDDGLLDGGRLRMRSMILPDKFIEAGPQADQYQEAGLARPDIVAKVAGLLQDIKDKAAATAKAPVAAARQTSFQVLP